MKKLFTFLALISVLACSEREPQEIYQGKLEELIVGDFPLIKDSLTGGFYSLRVVKEGDSEFILYTKSASKFKGWAFVFASTQTGKEVRRVEIPREGPNSMNGGFSALSLNSMDSLYLVNLKGDVGFYNSDGQRLQLIESEMNLPFSVNNMVRVEGRNGLSLVTESFVQFGQDPSSIMNVAGSVPGPGEMEVSFPLEFKTWLTRINLKTGVYEQSDLSIPTNYGPFGRDMSASKLGGAYDSSRQFFYLMWPYSNEIYQLSGLDLERKFEPESRTEFTYIPSDRIPVGTNYTAWVLPKEASFNIFLLYDSSKDLILKCTKINESGVGETKFERTKHYVLSIYSGDWDPLGEYFFDFENELELENWFLTSEGLFINKPEQKSEDEYEFYKIDLSRFGD